MSALKPYTEWGTNLKKNNLIGPFLALKNKLWFNLFLKVGLIFLSFILILTVANVSLLSKFFIMRQESKLISQMNELSKISVLDEETISDKLYEISEKYNFDAEIYTKNGKVLYTTRTAQIMDFFPSGNAPSFIMREEMRTVSEKKLSDGTTIKTAVDPFKNQEYLICSKQLEENLYAEIRFTKETVIMAAETANEFITIVAVICFILSLIWVFIFARNFSSPIIEMNEITKDMSRLNFSRRLNTVRNDEIGQLSNSINEMSNSLSVALGELKSANLKLKGEIELERQLDSMRRGFIANVSHELKTPISIISGYAEGLKLNINNTAKEEYCNTIIDESMRMNRLVSSILELSKYESGQICADIKTFDIHETADNLLKRITNGTNITVKNHLPSPLFVYGDPLQLEQVLKAYIENAVSHTGKDGLIEILFEKKNDSDVRIIVYNSGERIKEDIMPEIWQSFYRGDNSHKREENRFGLGLSIVSAIMKLHNKSFGVYNTELGVCFFFECEVKEQLEENK